MTEFEVLGTDQEIDPSEPVATVKSLVYLALGAGVLFMVLPIGRQIGSALNSMLANAVGMEVGDTDPGITFGSVE